MATVSGYFSAHKGGRFPAQRVNDGLHVQLLWRPQDDDVTVIVDDPAAGIVYTGSVARDRALGAFRDLFEESQTLRRFR
jgi:hypothetical protein